MIENDSWTGKFALLIVVSIKKGWLVRIGQEGFGWGWGELSKIPYTLDGGRTEKRGGDTKILKGGCKLGQVVSALKRGGGAGTLLQTMKYKLNYS